MTHSLFSERERNVGTSHPPPRKKGSTGGRRIGWWLPGANLQRLMKQTRLPIVLAAQTGRVQGKQTGCKPFHGTISSVLALQSNSRAASLHTNTLPIFRHSVIPCDLSPRFVG